MLLYGVVRFFVVAYTSERHSQAMKLRLLLCLLSDIAVHGALFTLALPPLLVAGTQLGQVPFYSIWSQRMTSIKIEESERRGVD